MAEIVATTNKSKAGDGSAAKKVKAAAEAPDVEGGGGEDVLQVGLGQADVPGAAQVADPQPCASVPSTPARARYSALKAGVVWRCRRAWRASCWARQPALRTCAPP